MRFVVTFITGLFLTHVSLAQNGAGLSSEHGKEVATIAAYDADGRLTTIGTGFIIEGGSIVTSGNVVRGAHYIGSTFTEAFDGEISGVGRSDRDSDLALLTTSSAIRSEGLAVSDDRPEVGSEVVVIGSPMGLKNNVTTGILSGVTSRGEVELLEISATVSDGSDGSPVLNSRGEVVGVVSSQFSDGEGLSFAVSAQHLIDMIGSQVPPVKKASGRPSYSIVVSSETTESSAEDVAQTYRRKGYEAQVLSFRVGETTRYRVCLGTYGHAASARSDRDRLAAADLPDDAWVVQVP